jgi:hypothetical protein
MHHLKPHGNESNRNDNKDYPLRPWQMGNTLVLLCANLSFDFTASIVLKSSYAVELKRYPDRSTSKCNTQPAHESEDFLRLILLHASKSEPKQNKHATEDEANGCPSERIVMLCGILRFFIFEHKGLMVRRVSRRILAHRCVLLIDLTELTGDERYPSRRCPTSIKTTSTEQI